MGLQQAKDAKERFLAMQRLRQKRHMPQHVLLADGDNELPVDLDNALCIEAFWGAAKNRESALLIEDYPGGKHLVASGPEGAFTHQLVLAFLAEPGAPGVPTPSPNLSEPMVRHAPGSEWLYAKLYTGQHSMEKLLAGPLNILTQEVMEAGDADRWFFIRYADPEPHLRLRFHGDPTRLWAMVLPRLQSALDPLLRNGWLWRFQLDTYEPELFRYGGANNQERAEQIFMADSEAAMKILAHHPGDEGIRGRWPLALASMDEYLASAGLSLGARLTMAQARLSGFSREFGLQGNPTSHQLGVRFRQERRLLETLFCPGQPPEGHLALGLAALAERSRRISPWLRSMGALEESGKLTTTLEDLLGSMIHMSVNRLLMSSQRAQEMILYDFLVRIYASRLAREGQTAGAQASTPAL
jgi:thiopeptide-type bacteriocin biosynthesis protein